MAERVTPFGKYYLLERINVGGMAEVFKAKTLGVEGFEKIVAIKRILPSVAEDEEFIKMFVDEAKITSQLSHANLAQTFDLGKINETFYIAMEYVPGKDLRAIFERLKRRGERMPLALAAFVISRVCEGLDYAHRKRDVSGRELGIVHRDVSPQNVIVSFEGEVKLIDFGIAKAANKITKTQAGILKGKFGYMSPEQVRGLPLDRRSDIFAAGVVLYELCTGERLFTGNSDFSVLEKVQQAKVTPPSQIEPGIPLKLERMILKALAREPEDRYQHAADLAADLTRFLLEEKNISRETVAAFMKGTFPDDNAREEATSPRERRPEGRSPPPDLKPDSFQTEPQQTQPDLERKPPPGNRPARGAPPLLPASLTQDLKLGRDRSGGIGPGVPDEIEVIGVDDPDATFRGPMPDGPPAEMVVRSKLQLGPLAKPGEGLPPFPTLPPLAINRPPPVTVPDPAIERAMAEAARAVEPGDDPTRPMSMAELAAKEREYAALEAKKSASPPSVHVLGADEPTPEGSRPRLPTPISSLPELRPGPPPPVPLPSSTPTREERRSRPPAPLPSTLFDDLPREPPPLPGEPLRPAGPRSAPARRKGETTPSRTTEKRVPYSGRMVLSKPTLVGDDPLPPDESTVSTLTRRARWVRRAQYGLVGLALVIAAWAWFSVPRPAGRKKDPSGAPPSGAVTVMVTPPDAVLLLDGAQVKDSGDKEWSERHLTAGIDHVLIARREGFVEQTVPVNVKADDALTLTLELKPQPGELALRSSPPGAQVWIDGVKRGVTPAYLPDVDAAKPHAISLEKKCYRPWQIGVPAHAGRREVVATLELMPGACPGRRLEKADAMPAPEVPDDSNATPLGFLSLSSRPSANVLIDGVDIGRQTPLLSWPLRTGSHRLRVVAGKRAKELSVDVRSGETHSEQVDLQPAQKRARR